MNALDGLQFISFIVLLFLLTKPMGLYLGAVLEPMDCGKGEGKGRTWLDGFLGPIEKAIYRLLRIDTGASHTWTTYALHIFTFSAMGLALTLAILMAQAHLPLNPQGLPGLSFHLAFNTAVSFLTNTNWQSYVPESTMSYLSQMVGLTWHNFTSAAVGISVAAVVVRGIAHVTTAKSRDSVSNKNSGLGNFWVDLVRIHLYLLVPMALVFAVFLLTQGMIQNFMPYTQAIGLEGGAQTIAQGPMASQMAIKMLGTNGGGFMNANAAHPFENPNALSNFLQMLAIFIIPAGLTYHLGRKVGKPAHGWAVFTVMALLFTVGTLIAWKAETQLTPAMAQLGVDGALGNMEGKEVRFGAFTSALFATVTTDASCGAVNAMHDSFTPLGGLVTLFNMQLGEIIFGGVGAGLYGMLVMVILTVFLAGLMVGRTPEYLGKKIEAFEVQMAVLAMLAPITAILGFTAWSAVSAWGTGALNNAGPHGFSEMLYAYTSAAANNGSAFAGLSANAPWWNFTLAFAMLLGRFGVIMPVLALAGSLSLKKTVPESNGSFTVTGITFGILLMGVILIVGGLTFLPALTMGPIIEHLIMLNQKLF
jgi:potassium-transporting ATPase potassium-binding subunit